MATGDVTWFDRFVEDIGNKLHNLSSDDIYVGLVSNATVPTAATADPRWGAGGTTDFSANEVTPGGNYSAGGVNCSVVLTDNWTSAAGVHKLDIDNVSIAQHASNPTGVYWGIIYNWTDTGKRAIGFVELGGPLDLTSGPFSITWNPSGNGTIS